MLNFHTNHARSRHHGCSKPPSVAEANHPGRICLTALLLVGCEKKEEKPKPGPPEVLVAEVVQQNVPISKDWVAQLNGPVNAEITPKVQGYLLRQDYQNGYFVKKGQLLFELDPRQYQAAVEKPRQT